MTTTEPTGAWPGLTHDGITVTATDTPGRYAVTGRRIAGMVTATMDIDDKAHDEYRNGQRVSVPTPVVTTWFGARTDAHKEPLSISGIDYTGHYAMTAQGRYVGAYVARLDGQNPTQTARSAAHAIGAMVATLHATKANIAAVKLATAEANVSSAERKAQQAADALTDARIALAKLQAELANH